MPRDDDDEFEDDDRPRRRRPRGDDLEPAELIVPLNVSPLSIIACYAGLVGMCLPVVGLVFAVPALVCGVIALRRRKSDAASSYGKVTGDIRAVVGVIFSTIGILLSGAMLLLLALAD